MSRRIGTEPKKYKSRWQVIGRHKFGYTTVSVGIAYIEQGENHGTTMILDGVSHSAFIHLCRVILFRMINPTVVSLQSDPFWARRVPLFGTYVSRRLLTSTKFPLQC